MLKSVADIYKSSLSVTIPVFFAHAIRIQLLHRFHYIPCNRMTSQKLVIDDSDFEADEVVND